MIMTKHDDRANVPNIKTSIYSNCDHINGNGYPCVIEPCDYDCKLPI